VIDGVLVIDKPEGITSHDVVVRARGWVHQRRVGHLGTLDPLATGVLPLALGEATKLSRLLTLGQKGYAGRIRLGTETATYDREGEVIEECTGPWPGREEVEKALGTFRGEMAQVPPPFSAVKRGGQASYRRARRGEEVKLEPRKVTIHELEITSYEPPFVGVEVLCSAGTYLRSLAHDLGGMLGTGGTLWDLRRTRSGPFTLDQAVRLDDLATTDPGRVIPMAASTGLPTYEVDLGTARQVSQGMQLGRHDVPGVVPRGIVQLVHKGKLVALLDAEPGIPVLRTVRVFLEWTTV
jgi:tRNA pseudouridine55 synthase